MANSGDTDCHGLRSRRDEEDVVFASAARQSRRSWAATLPFQRRKKIPELNLFMRALINIKRLQLFNSQKF
jgi:hypothetical protein